MFSFIVYFKLILTQTNILYQELLQLLGIYCILDGNDFGGENKEMQQNKTKFLVQGAVTAALYVVLTLISSLLGLAYGPVQFRISEILTLLPAIMPASVPGLIVGCFISNLWSPLGLVDIIFGTVATAAAALLSRALRNKKINGIPVFSAIPPVICNALIVGAEISLLSDSGAISISNFSLAAFLSAALSVGIGELVVCAVLGIPFLILIKRSINQKYL